MKYLELRNKIKLNLFTLVDVLKLFPAESSQLIKFQLSRFAKRKLIFQIKRSLYCFNPGDLDEFELANKLYQPSYISLESALNYYGLIPDIPQTITLVTLTTTKRITNDFGNFSYTKIKPDLFFGFTKIKSSRSLGFFNLAMKEKALLDYFYSRKIKSILELRLTTGQLDYDTYQKFARGFPSWVRKIKLK